MAALTQTISLVPGIELSPQEANRYKNIFAVQVPMCEVFRAVLKWECSDKQQGQTYVDYFGEKKQQYEDHHAALAADACNKFKLPKIVLPKSTIEMLQEEPSKYDVTLMFSFLFEIFKLKVSYTHIGHVRSLSKLECLLKEAKDIRNVVIHKVADDAVDPLKFDEIIKAMHDVIDEASNVYSIPDDQVTSVKALVDGMWDEVRTDNEKAKAYCCFFLQTYGNKEAKVMWEAMLSEETLLFGEDKVERSKVFHSLELTIQKPGLQAGRISYKELLSDTDKKFILVNGVSGSGKSTLLKNLVIQFHGISDAGVEMINLKNFNLILIYECRNRSIEQFSEVVQQNFENVCLKLGPETVAQTIIHSNPIILVDGYDECHKDAFKVVDQLVDKMKNHECRVIITTRPSHFEELKNHLKQKLLVFQDYEISEISDIEDQKTFLEKYEKHANRHAHEVVKTFSSLERNIQELFVHPIYLVLFCQLVWNFPERIYNWTSHAEVAHDIYRLYKKMVDSKLASYSIVDKDGLVNDLFRDVAKFSFQTIAENQLVFSEDQVGELKSSFRKTLGEYGARGELDPKALVGVVLKMKRHLNDFDSCTYFFHHKSIQELFASKTVIKELRKNNCLSSDLHGVSRVSQNLQGVLAYVLIELSAVENSNVFKRHWRRLKDAAKAVGADKKFWQQVLLSSPHSQPVAKETARAYMAHNKDWNIGSGRDADTVALLLLYQQPARLCVSLLDTPAPESWRTVAQTFKRVLELRLLSEGDDSRPCDHMLEALSSSSCSLSTFIGRVKNANSIRSLARIASSETELTIYTEPHMDLKPLQDKHLELWVIVEPTSQGGFVALPSSVHLCLRLKPVARNQQESLTRTILGLAPADNRFQRLEVRDCELTEAQLLKTLEELQRVGLRTLFRDRKIHAGPSRVLTIREKNFVLILTDEPPLPPQAEPCRPVAATRLKSPASLPVAPAVGGENLCPLASSCGDLDAVYRSLYALNVVLPHALRFVFEKEFAGKRPQDTYAEHLLSNSQPVHRQWLVYRIKKSLASEAFAKREFEEIDLRPFDSLPLIQLISELLDTRSQRIFNELNGERNYRNMIAIMEQVEKTRVDVYSNLIDASKLVMCSTDIINLVYELISEAANLYQVSEAETEQVKEACQSHCDMYESDVRIDDDAFAAFCVLNENRERMTGQASKIKLDGRDFWWHMSPGHWTLRFQCFNLRRFSSDPHDFKQNKDWEIEKDAMKSVFIYFKCRDRETNSFRYYIELNFPEACNQIGADNVEYVLTKLLPLILVDGYDEANAMSCVVVEEIINKFYKFPSMVVITTLPDAAFSKRKLLRNARTSETHILPFRLQYLEKTGLWANPDNRYVLRPNTPVTVPLQSDPIQFRIDYTSAHLQSGRIKFTINFTR
ncbi:uncharacterized protein LOC108667798 [Hyalella azteca]|uniref:Uncharacterized protein LOC108667798 n=1 Tax=Hyalella azteca TaxID=294128 RepID=A0A979FU15_HYAAZ|nr:uncharacterized protein LOC108667798 [Hyalella azteca]